MATSAKHWLDLFESQMQAQPFHLAGTDPMGNPISTTMFGMLEPINLYRFVFPKEAKGIVFKTLRADEKHSPIPFPVKWSLQKALGLKEVDKKDIPNVSLPVKRDNMHIVFLGYKEDPVGMFTENGVVQEKL